MATKKQHKEIENDYYYMVRTHGEPSDLTGGFVEGDKLEDLLKKPTITTAYNIYKSLLQYGFQSPTDYLWWCDRTRHEYGCGESTYKDVSQDKRAVEIHDKYHC
ncbi:MAG: hypothetical protein GY714_18275 [Desulfobacterales bacterium]|nr:hypothetical protein [Desulfobacterales bacterium]